MTVDAGDSPAVLKRERAVSFAPRGAVLPRLFSTHVLRRGLYSDAALRLGIADPYTLQLGNSVLTL